MSRETTASLRRCPSSPAAGPLEDDDLLAEILLRLPPLPSSLPRASAVCRRWRGLASDVRFLRRYRAYHRRNPPLLGCFVRNRIGVFFQPALEAPNRVLQCRFSFPMAVGDTFLPLGCRHGLMLAHNFSLKQLLVWDPVTGDQHWLDIPPGFDTQVNSFSAAVLRPTGDIQHFEVVLVGNSGMQHAMAVASVYSSETGVWGNPITLPLPSDDSRVYLDTPAVMVGDSLCWLNTDESYLGILEYDLNRRSLALIPMPGKETVNGGMDIVDIWVVLAEGGGLGLLFPSKFSADLWKRNTNFDGVTSWVLERTIALDKLLSINSEKEQESPSIIGFAEDNNVVLLWTSIGVFAVQLESLQLKKLFEPKFCIDYYPFEGIYTAGI